MKLRLQTHIECIYFCKWIAVGLSIAFIAAFSLESNNELKMIIKQYKRQKFFLTSFYTRVSRIRPTTRVGKPGICIRHESFRHHFRFYKKGDVDLWF